MHKKTLKSQKFNIKYTLGILGNQNLKKYKYLSYLKQLYYINFVRRAYRTCKIFLRWKLN